MARFCGKCFNESLNDQNICTLCGFDAASNRRIAPHALPAGTILNGRYIVGRILGQGGFGITYTARDHQTGQLMALKEFYPDSMVTRTDLTEVSPFDGERGENFAYGKETFLQEAQTMAEFIGNPNIVRVYSYFEENGTAYFVMEYVDGISFLDCLKSRGGKIPFEEALTYLYPMMDALSAVHEKGIIHRDVTPDNIYISKDGTVKLLDFGAARYSLGNASRSLDVILKHGFAPREQYKRRGRQGPFTDVYSLAATLYYSITGIRPDDALERMDEDIVQKPSTLGVKITKAQEATLMKAMAVDPEKRFQTMAEFQNAMKRAEPAVKPEKKSAEEPTSTAPVQTKKPKWLIPVAAALACIIGAAALLSGREAPSLSVEPTQISVTEQIVPTAATEAIPEIIPLTAEEIAYNVAVDLFYSGEYGKAAIAFGKLGDFRDAREISFKIWDAIAIRKTLLTNAAVREDGTIIAPDYDLENSTDVVAVDEWGVALRADGTVIPFDPELAEWVTVEKGWSNIVALDSGYYYGYIDSDYYSFSGLIGLKADGTIVALNNYEVYGDPYNNRDIESEIAFIEKLESFHDVIRIDGNIISTADGTMYYSFETADKYDASRSVYLKDDGTVHYPDPESHSMSWWSYEDRMREKKMFDKASSWENIVDMYYQHGVLIGLKSDGTMVAAGKFYAKENDFNEWTDIVSFCTKIRGEGRGGPGGYTLGLRSDGTVVSCGTSEGARQEAESWKNIKLPADRDALLAAIKLDYITN